MTPTVIGNEAPRVRGRDRELGLIGERLAALRAGVGATVLVEGPAGIGKSRLLAEGRRISERLGVSAGAGGGEPWESVAELAPLVRALFDGPRPLLERAGLRDLRLEPERRYWMLEDLQSLLERRARRGPLLICLDDLQWADGGTIAAVRQLPPRLASEPILWLLAARPDEAPPPLAAAFDELAGDGGLRLALEPLSPAAIALVTAEVLGADPDSALLALTRDAGGNPFLLVELLLGLRDEGLVRAEAGRVALIGGGLPDRMRQGMTERLARMSESARRVATVAASLGRSFSVLELAAMLRAAPAELLAAVDQLQRAQVLREDDGRLAFRHDLIREAIRVSSPESARRALDRQAAEVLLAAGALPTEVAGQLARSAEPGDTTAISTLRQAADALGPSDPAQAAELSARALELTRPGHPLRGALVAETTLLLHAAGDLPEASAFAQRHLRDVLPSADEAAVCLSIASMFGVSPDVRVGMSRRALTLPELSAGDRARHWSRLVYNLVQAGRAAESTALTERARAEVQAAQEPSSTTILMLAEDAQLYVAGRFEAALSLHEAAMRRGFGPGEASREWVARHWRCELLANLDRLPEAVALTQEGLAAAQRGRQGWAVEFFEIYRGRQLLQRGQIEEARVALEGRLDPARSHQLVGALYAAGLVALGRVAIHTADVRLRRQTAAMAELMRAQGTPATQGQALWLLALQAMADDEPEWARQLIGSAELAGAPSLLPLFPLDVTDEPHLVRLALAAGDRPLAEATAAAARTRAERNPGVAVIAGCAAHAQGLAWGDVEELEHAARRLGGGPRPLATASALEDLGVARLRAGAHPAGVDALDRALVLYAEVGARWDASRVRARLRGAGVRRRLGAAERPATGWEALTDSELTVAQLVAEGLTNRETAERLFVSPHTVTSHLRHAFTKLGVNSRVELARVLGDPDRDRPPVG